MNRVIQTSYIIEESPYDSKQRQEKFLQKLRHIANTLPNGLSIPTDLESYSSVYIAALLGELETCKRLLREDFVSSSERPVDFFNPSTLRELNTSRLHKSFVTSLLFFGICSSNYELTNWLFDRASEEEQAMALTYIARINFDFFYELCKRIQNPSLFALALLFGCPTQKVMVKLWDQIPPSIHKDLQLALRNRMLFLRIREFSPINPQSLFEAPSNNSIFQKIDNCLLWGLRHDLPGPFEGYDMDRFSRIIHSISASVKTFSKVTSYPPFQAKRMKTLLKILKRSTGLSTKRHLHQIKKYGWTLVQSGGITRGSSEGHTVMAIFGKTFWVQIDTGNGDGMVFYSISNKHEIRTAISTILSYRKSQSSWETVKPYIREQLPDQLGSEFIDILPSGQTVRNCPWRGAVTGLNASIIIQEILLNHQEPTEETITSANKVTTQAHNNWEYWDRVRSSVETVPFMLNHSDLFDIKSIEFTLQFRRNAFDLNEYFFKERGQSLPFQSLHRIFSQKSPKAARALFNAYPHQEKILHDLMIQEKYDIFKFFWNPRIHRSYEYLVLAIINKNDSLISYLLHNHASINSPSSLYEFALQRGGLKETTLSALKGYEHRQSLALKVRMV